MKKVYLFSIVIIWMLSTQIHGQVFVDLNASGANNGTSWTDAYTDLGVALNNTSSGQVWVADGIYKTTSCLPCTQTDRDIEFTVSAGVEVYGGFSGTESQLSQRNWTVNETIINGDIGVALDSTDNTTTLIKMFANSRLDGLIVEHGNSDGGSSSEGVVHSQDDGLVFKNCTFRNNTSYRGGGIDIRLINCTTCETVIEDCHFERNRANDQGGAILINTNTANYPTIRKCTFFQNLAAFGGAVELLATFTSDGIVKSVIDSCDFRENYAFSNGGALLHANEASFGNSSANLILKNSSFIDNGAGGRAGAMFLLSSVNPAIDTIANCIFIGNGNVPAWIDASINTSMPLLGGALWSFGVRSQEVINCVFSQNTAVNFGGAIYHQTLGSPAILYSRYSNCTFWANNAGLLGASIYMEYFPTVDNQFLNNSILWGGTDMTGPNEIGGAPAGDTMIISNTDIAGGIPSVAMDGGGNLDIDPDFVNAAGDNFRLNITSPLIDIGPTSLGILDACDVDGDGNTTEEIDVDVNGNQRVYNGNIDLGAYEWNPPPPPPTAVCQDFTLQLNPDGIETLTGSDIDGGSSVTSGDIHLYASPNYFTCDSIGVREVTLCVTNDIGETSSCIANVSIVDVTAPTCESQDISVTVDMTGIAVINAIDLAVPPVLGMIDSGEMMGGEFTNEVALADMDNDGDLDAVIANQNSFGLNPLNTIYFNDGSGSFTPSGVFFGPALVRALGVSDLDGDGDLDIVMSSTLGEPNSYFNDGAGNFSAGTLFISATNAINMAIGDLNGDCSPDIFVGNGGGSPNTVKFNNGDGTFTDSGQFLGAGVSWTVELGDVDNDGDLDAVVANTTSTDVVWINDGNGNFTDSGQALYAGQSTGMRLGDLDSDGDLDYFVTNNNFSDPSKIYLNNGLGVFSLSQDVGQSVGHDVELRDFDKDGDLDAYIVNGNQPDSLWMNDGSGVFTYSGISIPIQPGFGSASGDVDGDSDFDVLVGMTNAGVQNQLILNTLSGTFDGCTAFQDLTFSANPPSFDCSAIGTTQAVVLTVTDESGNSSTCISQVTVTGAGITPPTCMTQNITVQLDASGMVSIAEDAVDNGSTGVCQPLAFNSDVTDFDCSDIGPQVVMLTVSDIQGNTSTCNASVTVEDNLTPDPICQDIVVQLDAGGIATISGGQIDNGSTDNCSVSNFAVTPNTFDINDLGMNPVVLTVTDVNGNTSTCSAMADVQNNNAPNAVCMPATLQLDLLGMATLTPTDVDGGSSAVAGIASMTVSPDQFDCSALGGNSTVLTITDNMGMTATCSTTVTVEDNIAPEALCQSATVVLDGSGMAMITPADIDSGSNDACGSLTMMVSPDNFDMTDVGPNTVTLTVTDGSGNTSTCSSIVTVMDIAVNAVCQDFTISLDGAGQATVLASDIDNGSSASSGIQSMVVSPNMFDCSLVGSNQVVLTITDNNSVTASCSATVNVLNNSVPVINCPADINSNSCTSIVPVPQPGVTSVCGFSLTNDFNGTADASDFYPVGMTTVVWTATDVNGSIATCSMMVTVNNNLSTNVGSTLVSCAGGDDGTATAGGTGGTQPYTYLWSDGQSSEIATGLSTGFISLIITDSNGCTSTGQTVVMENDPIVIGFQAANVDCFGECTGLLAAQANGGASGFSYLWSDGQTDILATNLCAGTYTITITDVLGCEATATAPEITEPTELMASVTSNNVVCGVQSGSASATASGGASGYEFLWSTGETSTMVSGLTPGTYSLSATDGNGCADIITFQIQEEGSLMPQVSFDDPTCFGGLDGIISINNTGTLFYNWSTGAMTPTVTGLTAGSYSFTLTDALTGCEASGQITLNVPPPLLSDVLTFDSSCGEALGSAMAIVSGGISPFTYLWSNGASTSSINNLTTGSYSVTITDGNGCEEINSAFVSSLNNGPVLSSTQVNVSCVGANDGSIDLMVNGGVEPLTFMWNDGIMLEDRSGLSPGAYTVLVTDANGCLAATTVVISESGELTIQMSATPTSGNDGTAAANVFGGSPPFTYQWSNGGTTPVIVGLSTGVYTVFVTDANGCTGTGEVTVWFPVSTFDVEGLEGFEVYPNPSTGQITIDILFERSRDFKLMVYNTLGQKLMEEAYSEQALILNTNLSEFGSGVYYVSVHSKGKVAVKRLIIIPEN